MINIDFKDIEIMSFGISDSSGSGNVDLSNYYTKSEIDRMIPSTEEFIKEIPKEVYYFNFGVVGSTDFNDMSNAINKGYIINVYNIPDMEFINNTIFNVSSKSSTSIQLVGTRCTNGATNGNKTDVNITTITITLKSDNTRTYKANSPVLKMIGGGTKFLADNGKYVEIDTSIVNRISALESELTGVSEQITELNNMVV